MSNPTDLPEVLNLNLNLDLNLNLIDQTQPSQIPSNLLKVWPVSVITIYFYVPFDCLVPFRILCYVLACAMLILISP